jgi:hypothetical protein
VAEARAEGPLARGTRLSVNALYSNAAGFANSTNYWYGSVNVNVIVPFGH